MSFLGLPNELILEIVKFLDSQRHILAVTRTNRRLYLLLSDYGLKWNIKNRKSSMLIWAAFKNRQTVVRRLLGFCADVNTEGKEGDRHTPLYAAAANGHLGMVKLLLKSGADPDLYVHNDRYRPLVVALEKRHENVARILLGRMNGANIYISEFGSPSQSPLHIACRWKLPNLVQYLLDNGADVGARDAAGNTTLQLALLPYPRAPSEDVFNTVRSLLKSGATPDSKAVQLGENHDDPGVRLIFPRDDDQDREKFQHARIGRQWMKKEDRGSRSPSPTGDAWRYGGTRYDPRLISTRRLSDYLRPVAYGMQNEIYAEFGQESSHKADVGDQSRASYCNSLPLDLPTILRPSAFTGPNSAPPKPDLSIDSFPSLTEGRPGLSPDISTKALWSDFRNSEKDVGAQLPRAKPSCSENNLLPELKATKAKGKKRWQPLQL